jgi:hypothetical protein
VETFRKFLLREQFVECREDEREKISEYVCGASGTVWRVVAWQKWLNGHMIDAIALEF